MEIIFIVS